MTTTLELAEWMESRSRTSTNLSKDPGIPRFKAEAHREDADYFLAAARRLRVLEAVAEAAKKYRTWLEPHGPITESDRLHARNVAEAFRAALDNLENAP